MGDIKKWQEDFRDYVNGLCLPKDDHDGIMEYISEIPSAQPERMVFEEMSDTEFEKWLHEHGICNPDIHESIPCYVVPSLIDFAINELPSAQPEKVCIARINLSEERVREAVERAKNEIVQMLPSAQPGISRIEQELHGKTPEEQYEFLYWLLKFGLAYTDSRLAVIEWLRGERNE